MSKLLDLWAVLIGELSRELLLKEQASTNRAWVRADNTKQELNQLKHDTQPLRAAVESLKHLQKYEGMQKIESDVIGHKAEVALLKEEIATLRQCVKNLEDDVEFRKEYHGE